MTIYNQLDFKTSRLYEYSKTEKEGFDEHVNTVGTKSYRRYQNSGVTGTLANVSVKESKIGDQLNVTLRDEDGNYLQNQFSLYDQNGFVDNNFCEDIISKLRNMKKGEVYTTTEEELVLSVMERELIATFSLRQMLDHS